MLIGLSNYARLFLGGTNKPNVDSIEGLSPSISIEQKTTHNNPRSTVGTVTEIYDYFRLLFARIGKPYCPNHKIPITTQTNNDILKSISWISRSNSFIHTFTNCWWWKRHSLLTFLRN